MGTPNGAMERSAWSVAGKCSDWWTWGQLTVDERECVGGCRCHSIAVAAADELGELDVPRLRLIVQEMLKRLEFVDIGLQEVHLTRVELRHKGREPFRREFVV